MSITVSQAQILIAKSGNASFYSEAPLENIEAVTTSIQSILNTANNSVAFIIPISGFKFKKDLMREHFNEKYMESDKYPNATYNGKVNESVDWTKDGVYDVTSTGKLTIHGVEKEVTQPGKFTIKNGEAQLESSFPIIVDDYKIEIPRLLFENIADTVAVKVNVTYQPYKK